MKQKILTALIASSDQYLSGERLSEDAGVSRTSIWKHINQLREEGYAIDSIPSKGYRLTLPEDYLLREDLMLQLQDIPLVRDVKVLKTVDSTNTYGKTVLPGSLIIAEEQTGGKGRLGRTWYGPQKAGLWFSLVLQPELEPSKAALLTQVAAVAVWEGIEAVTNLQAEIKWPNDILIQGKKLCGILTEMQSELGMIERLIVGIGINVNVEAFPEELRATATSLKIETGASILRRQLLVEILKRFQFHYDNLLTRGDYTAVIDCCRKYSSVLGKKINLISAGKTEAVLALDILPGGELLVQKSDGTEQIVFSGEVSVRSAVD